MKFAIVATTISYLKKMFHFFINGNPIWQNIGSDSNHLSTIGVFAFP